MAHFGALQQMWRDTGVTPQAAARPGSGFGQPAAAGPPAAAGCGAGADAPRPAWQSARHSFQPGSRPSQRSVASPILQVRRKQGILIST